MTTNDQTNPSQEAVPSVSRKEAGTAGPDASSPRRLAELVGLFLRLGFTAFGGPAAHIAMMRTEVVERRRWVSEARFVDLIGITNLIPGPSSTELAIYLGYLRAGWLGLLLAGVCFIGPAMLIVLALAWAYVTYGALPQIGWLFYGIQPVVVAIIAQALWNLGRTIFKGILAAVVALLVLALYLLGTSVLVLLFGGALCYGALRLLERQWKHKQTLRSMWLPAGLFSVRFAWKAALPGLFTGLLAAAAPVSLLVLFLTFLKLGAVVYGSGYTLLAFLRTDLVQNLHWLTDKQLLDAVSVGQFTPGPVFTTATFIGYLVGGFPGAALATLGIFLPSFCFIALVHPVAARLRQATWTATLLDGVNVAALALMTGVLLQLGQHALTDVLTWAVALLSFAILVRFKPNSVWLILAGGPLGCCAFGCWEAGHYETRSFSSELKRDVEEVVMLQVLRQGIDLRQCCLRLLALPDCHRLDEPRRRRGLPRTAASRRGAQSAASRSWPRMRTRAAVSPRLLALPLMGRTASA